VAGGQGGRIELARRRQQIREFNGLIARHARDRRLSPRIALGERLDHRLAEARLVIEHVMGNAKLRRHLARIMDVLPGAAGAGAMRRCPMIVELQGHADDVVAGAAYQPGDYRGIDAARHGDHHAGAGPVGAKSEIDVHHGLLRRSATIVKNTSAASPPSLPNVKEFQGHDLGEF
jgi:hypothetical protein